MNKVNFIIVGEEITEVRHETNMTKELIDSLLRTFIDLGWIMTEIKTEGFFELTEDDSSVHFEYQLTENDGNVEPYELDEDNFSSLLESNEVEPTKKIGYVGMSNVSKA